MNLIIDANNLAHRARHAYNLSFKGRDTSVTFGVVRMLMSLVNKYSPISVLMCWDGGTPGYRRRLVPVYKTGRYKRKEDPTWPDFVLQVEELLEILPHAGVLQVKRGGIEADDLVYHASRMLVGDSVIVSSDDDLLQCVNDNVSVLKPIKDEMYTADNFEEKVGYPPFKHVLAKVLQGDQSDCVRGVIGIGPVTAVKLLQEDDVLAAATPKMRERIERYIETGQYVANYSVIDLHHDLSGARKAILDAEWIGYDNSIYAWCIKNGFTSIIEAGSLGKIFGSLREPVFDVTGMCIPVIWDYKRESP